MIRASIVHLPIFLTYSAFKMLFFIWEIGIDTYFNKMLEICDVFKQFQNFKILQNPKQQFCCSATSTTLGTYKKIGPSLKSEPVAAFFRKPISR